MADSPVLYKQDVRLIAAAVEEAATYMYTGANAGRTDSIPLRLFVQVGTYAVYFRTVGAMTDAEADRVLGAVETNLHKLETVYAPAPKGGHAHIKDQNDLYDDAMAQPRSPPRLARTRSASALEVLSPPRKRLLPRTVPDTVASLATDLSTNPVVPVGVGEPGEEAAQALAAGGGARRPFAPLDEVRTIPGTAPIIDAELKKLFNDFVADTASEYGPSTLISIAHAAAIVAALGTPANVAIVAGGAHAIDFARRQYIKRKRGDEPMRAMVDAALGAGRRTGSVYVANVVGSTWLARARRAASPVSNSVYNLWVNMPPTGQRVLTWKEKNDLWAAAAENTPLTFIPEFLANHPRVMGGVGVGAGALVIARNYSNREVVYERQRLKAWFTANNEDDAKLWMGQVNSSLSFVKNRRKRQRKATIKDHLDAAMTERKGKTRVEDIEEFIDNMQAIDASLKTLLADALNPEFDTRLNPRDLAAAYAAADAVDNPAAPAAGAAGAGGLFGLGPLVAVPPGGGAGAPVVEEVFAKLHRVRLC